MKKIVSLICLLSITLSVFAQNRALEVREKLLNADTSSVIVVAHRAYWRYMPENSLEAVQHSIKIGVDIAEIDLQRTKDGHLIVMHDKTVDRTTNGKGAVKDLTLCEIKSLFLKNGCGIKTTFKVPTLEEVFAISKDKILLNLDKSDRYFKQIIKIADSMGMTKQILMKSPKKFAKVDSLYKQYIPKVLFMPVVDLNKDKSMVEVKSFENSFKPVAFELLYAKNDNPRPEEVKKYLKGKSLIWYNTLWGSLCGDHDDDRALNDPNSAYGYLIDTLGARIIQTDRAQYLLDYLRKRGLHK